MVNTSSDGAFVVIGSNNVQNLDLISWAQELSRMTEKAVGLKTPYGGARSIRIIVENGDPAAPAKVLADERGDGADFSQTLRIVNYDKVDVVLAGGLMCKLLLNGYVLSCREKTMEAGATAPAPMKPPASVPVWLYRGIAQYINQDLRPENAELILLKWRKKELKTLPELLDAEPKDQGYPYDASCGMIIAWLQSFPGKDEFFGKMFAQLAAGEALSSEWFAKNAPGSASISDLKSNWENWLVSQLNVIHKPGVATPLSIDQLKDRLVIQPDDKGMPAFTNEIKKITFDELVDVKVRESPWLPLALQNKAADLRLFAVGRGKELGDVVDSYCKFLDAVVLGKRQGTLVKLLEKARKDLKDLESKVGVGKAETDRR